MNKKHLFAIIMLVQFINGSTAAPVLSDLLYADRNTDSCSIIISPDLSFRVPFAEFDGGDLPGRVSFQIDFLYAGEKNGNLRWQLVDVNPPSGPPSCAIAMASDLSFSLTAAVYGAGMPAGQMAWQLDFAYAGEENGKFLWRLTDLKVHPIPSEPGRIYQNSLGMTFVHVPAGTFAMGSPSDERFRVSYETLHQVTLTRDYYLQTTEVTQGQWESVMGTNPARFNECGPDCPVEQVSWGDIQHFIARLNQMGEGTYALPTEAQWEYAARAGSGSAFANGDITKKSCGHDPNLDALGWYCGNSEGRTHPVGRKQPNAWGFYDMHGNVWEWVADWYEDYPDESVEDPTGPVISISRVIRGGSWNRDARYCRAAFRNAVTPEIRYDNTGFRLVFFPGPVQ